MGVVCERWSCGLAQGLEGRGLWLWGGLCVVLKNHYIGFCWWVWRWLLVRGRNGECIERKVNISGNVVNISSNGVNDFGNVVNFCGAESQRNQYGEGKCLGIRWEGLACSS